MKNKLALDGRYYNVFEKDDSLRAKIVESEKEGLYIIRLSLSKRDSLVCPICTDGKKCLKNSEALGVLYSRESNVQLRNPDFDYNYFNLSAKVCSKTKKMYLINGLIQERIFYSDEFKNRCYACNSPKIKLEKGESPNDSPVVYDTYYFATYMLYMCSLCGFHTFVVKKENREERNPNTGLPDRFVL